MTHPDCDWLRRSSLQTIDSASLRYQLSRQRGIPARGGLANFSGFAIGAAVTRGIFKLFATATVLSFPQKCLEPMVWNIPQGLEFAVAGCLANHVHDGPRNHAGMPKCELQWH
jgi:hypothetical protein